VVSARPVRLKKRAGEGSRGAQAALDLAEKPDNFLSTVQIGITLIELKAALGLKELPDKESSQYHTLAGFIMTQLGKLPGVGEKFEWNNFIFEVVAMELNRVDKVRVTSISDRTNVADKDI